MPRCCRAFIARPTPIGGFYLGISGDPVQQKLLEDKTVFEYDIYARDQVVTCIYDEAQRLTEASENLGNKQSYMCEATGNRLTTEIFGVITSEN